MRTQGKSPLGAGVSAAPDRRIATHIGPSYTLDRFLALGHNTTPCSARGAAATGRRMERLFAGWGQRARPRDAQQGSGEKGNMTPPTTGGVRVRFAPSPTGYLHVGGVRTALYNWLFARAQGGMFVLRIEDTDVERSTEDAVRAILDGLRWLSLDWDEGPEVGGPVGPYRQMERESLYRDHVARLVREGKAYPCTCAAEELAARRAAARSAKQSLRGLCPCRETGPAAGRKQAVRFHVPAQETVAWDDLIQGRIEVAAEEVDDFIILRSDERETPVYNFAAVVDDALMRITHVVRGADHIPNTPRQILLYDALGYPLPAFGHIPLVLGSDREKLSKRHGDVALHEYRAKGYLPHALVNYLVRLGWAHGDKEIFTREELIQDFRLETVGAE
ncbi:MAG: glutamate--tRNA ligase, partial [Zetaproteobacteria bacterium]